MGPTMNEQASTAQGERSPGAVIMASYGMGRFTVELLTGAFSAVVFKFYETEIGLAGILVAVGFVVHSVWNAVAFPLVGWFTGKPTFLSARLGRRFPWIALGAPFSVLAFVLVFAPPAHASPLLLLAWLVLASCLYDAMHSVWELNYQSVFPDKFREYAVRDKAAGIGTVVGTFGVIGGAIIPTLFIVYGDPSSYLRSAVVIALIGLVAVVLLMPGVRETASMIRRFALQVESTRERAVGFFSQLRAAFAHRDFVAFILLYFFYQAAVLTMQSSIYYVGDYLLGGRSTTLIFAAMLVGALVSIPAWLAWSKRSGSHQRSLLICAVALAAFSLPMTFVTGYTGFVVCMALWGVAFGGFWFLLNPAMADVVDEIVVKTGIREDGIFYGFRAFFGKLSLVVQAVSFWIIHELTGFRANPRSPLAILGIHIHLSLLPTVLILVGALFYWKLNDLTPEKCARNKERLTDLGL